MSELKPSRPVTARGMFDNSTRDDALSREMEKSYSVIVGLIHRANRYMLDGRLGVATVYGQITAFYAMSQHSGLFSSPTLERLLLAVGRQLTVRSTLAYRRESQNGTRKRVVHVLTRADAVGGDARMVWRWIQRNPERSHSVVLTRQGAHPVPSHLQSAVSDAGGQIVVLNRHRGTLNDWALLLRRIVVTGGFDLVVLHVHPYDVIPVVAFADRRDIPPIIYVDHADHAFWIGASVSDLVVSLRSSGSSLARTRRGIPHERLALLPIALNPIERTLDRATAKSQIGISPDDIVLLSVARPHKYLTTSGPDFLDGILPVLADHPRARLLVVGPSDTGSWAEAKRVTGGRVRALGTTSFVNQYYQAADVYVDSYPVVSNTSLLEAGSYGVPLVSRCPFDPDSVLSADMPGLMASLIRVSDLSSFRLEIGRLIEDQAGREALGRVTRDGILGVHSGSGWLQQVSSLYERIDHLPTLNWEVGQTDEPAIDELDLALRRTFFTEPNLESIQRFHLRLLPANARFAAWSRLLVLGDRPRPGLLLPEWCGTAMEDLQQRLRAALRRSWHDNTARSSRRGIGALEIIPVDDHS